MRSLAESRSRWNTTFAHTSNLSDLRASVKRGAADSPSTSGLRSVCWKAFLVFENLDQSTWPKTIRDSRGAYASLKGHLVHDLKNSDDLSATDPLADDLASPWNTLRSDELLRAEIFQDVERCMPENLYFREPTTQSMLLDILFIYCKLNADVGYRQGMHEILAPILWVVSRDAIDLGTEEEGSDSAEGDHLILSVLSQKYIEHDAFTIFGILMQTARSFYETASSVPQSESSNVGGSAIVERSRRIHEDYLQRVDSELAAHLTAIDILPQIFVIRWIRLLFGREFPFEDVLCLWDVLFAEDPGLSLVDYVCVAMLVRVRWQLLKADYSSALALLLRYPVPSPPNGPITFVEDALYLRRNLTEHGGVTLISKYSGKAPTHRKSTNHQPSLSRKSFHTPRNSEDVAGTRSPMRSPGQLLQDSGGIEGLLQEAAKGMYRRSEQWGLGQALRSAVQGLHSGSNTPRRSSVARRSLDETRASNDIASLSTRVQALQDRNKTLARMLQESIEEISTQAKQFEQEKQEAQANKLTLSVAKLQFLQVHLEDSAMPLGPDGNAYESRRDSQTDQIPEDRKSILSPSNKHHAPIVSPAPSLHKAAGTRRQNSQDSQNQSPSRAPVRRPAKIPTVPQITRSESPQQSPFQSSRPSLASSSFSWMLGDGDDKSSFVSATPLSPERDRKLALRGKAGFLFGDDKNETAQSKLTKENTKSDKEDDEGFTLGTLKGIDKR